MSMARLERQAMFAASHARQLVALLQRGLAHVDRRVPPRYRGR
jgi:hypothetical protein